MERDVTPDEAKWFLSSSDVWGPTRLYGVIVDEPYTGQIKAIKSVYHLEQYGYSRLYLVTTTVTDMIKPAKRGK